MAGGRRVGRLASWFGSDWFSFGLVGMVFPQAMHGASQTKGFSFVQILMYETQISIQLSYLIGAHKYLA